MLVKARRLLEVSRSFIWGVVLDTTGYNKCQIPTVTYRSNQNYTEFLYRVTSLA